MTKFDIKEMSCNHCVDRIHNLLAGLNINHEVDLSSKSVSIDGDEATLNQAVEELADIGFTATRK
ncbi:heavy-metal-associated domain-containing protein [Lachnoclostridium phytofermentans]|uniref:Heavy metal transport/detoxification protein n=1 Tax=Lachnoclostridium phytofermentans (strain ATCC 700394 / DSM 18823 / ISDg) TaxID=357809 RepID=A9KL73_LACP7|nr:heavy-metal-associated domain-containing protein [Lachnoclostridium phytofermentans]ABX44222.1 Heavy metal transport/detoxification protein [Lachnoclostridium phytofermentans ISDg]